MPLESRVTNSTSASSLALALRLKYYSPMREVGNYNVGVATIIF